MQLGNEPGPSSSNRPAVGEVTDALFGTRSHTTGAKYQVPRKVPLRIEPKTYFGASQELSFELTVKKYIGIGRSLRLLASVTCQSAFWSSLERHRSQDAIYC